MSALAERTAARAPDLTRWLAPGAAAWLHGETGLVGTGRHERLEVPPGPERFELAWQQLRERWAQGGAAGTAFVSFTFDEQRAGSRLLVPEGLVGRTGTRLWSDGPATQPPRRGAVRALPARGRVRYRGASVPELRWLDTVADAAAEVAEGRLSKVVLARDVTVTSPRLGDVAALVRRLATRFPACYVFAVDGLVGATPELLLRRRGRQVSSLVLAGSAPRGADGPRDDELAGRLLRSAKDRAEHRPAVESVATKLRPRCATLHVDPEPSVLRLANIQHLATRIHGTLAGTDTALALAGALHPTAAVCGTPTPDALAWIRAHEGLDRGRYAGPVGWVDEQGDGELGIALRCLEIDGLDGRLFSGAGVVGDSLPEAELEETRLKLHAVQALLEDGEAHRPGATLRSGDPWQHDAHARG